MAENRALLSQAEIDALVSFLQDKTEVSMDAVLDQSSIDRIIELIKFNNDHGIYFDNKTPDLSKTSEEVIVDAKTGSKVDKDNCIIEVDFSAGAVKIYVVDTKNTTRYEIGPECLVQRRYVADDSSSWGLAIAPKTLSKIANLFRIDYSSDTMKQVCEKFGEVMYGSKDADIAGIYLPPEI